MFKQKKQKNTAAENRLGANQKIGILFCAMVSAVATGYVPNNNLLDGFVTSFCKM